jgi:hypothetical protein
MYSIRTLAIIAAFLIIAVSIPPSLFSQPAPASYQPKRPGPPKRQAKRPQRADALASVINELLKLDPLPPQSPDEKAPEGNAPEDDGKPPADDAPIKELIAYCSKHGADDELASKLSDRVRQRLLEICEELPDLIPSLIDYLPEKEGTHDRLYKLLNEEPDDEESWKPYARTWLRRKSAYFRDELIKAARAADDDDIVANEDLRALARLDWNAARPILETLASAGKAKISPIALALLYEHATKESESARAESYRALLKAIVENRHAYSSARREALAGLMISEWGGQEEWVISLFADPTLSGIREDEIIDAAESKNESIARRDTAQDAVADDGITVSIDWEFSPGILTTLLYGNTVFRGNPDRWLPIISNLVGHNHRTVHTAAVKCLVWFLKSSDEKKKKEIAQQLIPWLTEPTWVAKEVRGDLIINLISLNMPELAPGLIWILDYDEDSGNRATAAEALAQYRDQRANPALRRALEKEENEYLRGKIVTALAQCGGLSDDEMAEAVEAFARMVVTEEGAAEIEVARLGESDNPLPLKVSIGRILNDSETIEATEGLAVRLIERAKALRASQPAAAREILRVIEAAPLRAVEINLVERIGEGWADVDSVALALEYRDALEKSAGAELYGLIKQGGYAAGIAAVILNDEREWKAALKGRDAKAQLALLACARYLRDKLPVELVARLLNSQNRALAKAAESYLEVEDSAEARKLVLARHPGEVHILGDITANGEAFIEAARSWENALRKEMRGRSGLEAIYAVGQKNPAAEFTGVIIRVRGGKAEMSVHETEGRRNVRWLTDGEFEELKSFTSRQEIEDLGPKYYEKDEKDWLKYEYLRLTKEGGRRIVLNDLRRAPKNPTPHEELSGLFYRLSRSGEFVTRYAIEDKIPGVEVLLADRKQQAMMICGEGREIRVLVGEIWNKYRRGFAEAMPEWHDVSSGKLGKVTDEPTACPRLSLIQSFMKIRSKSHYSGHDQLSGEQLLTRSGAAWVYDLSGIDAGVWKVEPEAEPEKIIDGSYTDPVVTPDGKWLVAIKTLSEGVKHSSQLVRHNLQTGEEFQIKMANDDNHPPIVYVAAHGKVLRGNLSFFYGEAHLGAVNYLLDPETGTLQQASGEFRPLADRFAGELQPTGKPNEFWAAIRDSQKGVMRIGRYDSRNFAFEPLVELTGLPLGNRDFWVDATAGKIWIAYYGHLLRIPLPQKTK